MRLYPRNRRQPGMLERQADRLSCGQSRLVGQTVDSPGPCGSRGDAGDSVAPAGSLWRRIAWWGVVLLTQGKKAAVRWRWETLRRKDGSKVTGLVSPSGRVWEFRLNKGAWVRPWEGGQS